MIHPDKQPVTETREDYHEGLWGRVYPKHQDRDDDPTWRRDVGLMVALVVVVTALATFAAGAIEASWSAHIAASLIEG